MKNGWDKKYIKFGVVLALSICFCIVFAEIIEERQGIFDFIGRLFSAMTPVIIGVVLAFLLNPIMIYIRKGFAHIFSKWLKKSDYDKVYAGSKIPALILTILLFLAVLVAFFWTVIPSVYSSLQTLMGNMQNYIDTAQDWIDKVFAKYDKIEGQLHSALNYVQENLLVIVEEQIMPNLDTIISKISNGIIVGVKAVFNFLVGLIVTVYLLAGKDDLLAQGKKLIYCIFSKKMGNKIMEGLSYANSVFGGFINGKILDSLIIGVLCYIFTGLMHMQYAVLISVIVGVTNIIPFFGPFIGAIPGSLLALMDEPLMFVIFIIFIIVLQQFDGNILGPLILGDSTGLSSFWVLFAILIGGDLFGVVGMVLGVPVFACLYAFVAILLRDGLRAKELSSKTEDYYRLTGFNEETGEPVYRSRHEGRHTIKARKRRYRQLLQKKKQEQEAEQRKKEAEESGGGETEKEKQEESGGSKTEKEKQEESAEREIKKEKREEKTKK